MEGHGCAWLHISSILPTHIIKGMTDLPFRVVLHGFHQLLEDVFAVAGGLLEEG
jgi:hypothetical protein